MHVMILEKLKDNTECLVENVSIMTSRPFRLYRCIKFFCLFIFQIKIHFRFVRHWLWLNRVTAAFSPECLFFLKKRTKLKFYLLYDGRRLDEVNRGTSGPYGAGNNIPITAAVNFLSLSRGYQRHLSLCPGFARTSDTRRISLQSAD